MYESEKWKWSHSVVSDSSRPHGLQPTRLLCPWDFAGKNTGVGCHCLLHLTPYSSPKLGAPLAIMRSKPNCLTAHMFLVVIWLVDTRNELDLECIDYHECIVWIQVGNIQFSPVRSLSRVWLCDPMNHSTPVLPVHHQLPESTQTHVHWVGDAILPSHPLLSPAPSALNLSQHQGLFQMSQFFASGDQSIGVSASASVLPMNIQDWFPLELTDLISLQSSQGDSQTLKSLLQHHSSKN